MTTPCPSCSVAFDVNFDISLDIALETFCFIYTETSFKQKPPSNIETSFKTKNINVPKKETPSHLRKH